MKNDARIRKLQKLAKKKGKKIPFINIIYEDGPSDTPSASNKLDHQSFPNDDGPILVPVLNIYMPRRPPTEEVDEAIRSKNEETR